MADYFDYLAVPMDEDDPRYCKSFRVEEASSEQVQHFFDEYGFCVFRDVIRDDQCRSTFDDMWQLVEESNPGVTKSNPETWSSGFSSFGMPKNTGSQALLRPSLLRLRQNPNVVQCFAGILKSEEIVCSHDRSLMHLPTFTRDWEYREECATRPNVHLDLNPREYFDTKCKGEVAARLASLKYDVRQNRAFISENNDVHSSMGRVVQGIINLSDLPSTRNGGGTLVVPGSHRSLAGWVWEELKGGKTLSSTVGPTQQKFGPDMLAMAQRVCMRAGSLVIWDQRLIHGSTTNRSRKVRCGVPVRFYHSEQLRQQSDRAKDRARVIRAKIQLENFEGELSEIGRKVFGLDLVGDRR